MAVKTTPHNLEAEEAVLGAILIDSNAVDMVQELVSVEDFYKPAHRKIYEAALDLHRKGDPIDPITLSHALNAKNELEQVGGAAYITKILENSLGAYNIEKYAELITETANLRKLIEISLNTVEKAYSGDYQDVASFIDETEANVFGLNEKKKKAGLVSSSDIIKSTMLKIEDLYQKKSEVTGLSYGFKDMDKMTAGLHPGEMIILAARPSMGKTAFSLNIAQDIAVRQNKVVAYFSLEMGTNDLMMRMIASQAKVNMGDIRIGRLDKGDSWSRIINAAHKISESGLFIDDTASVSPFDLRAKCRRLKAQRGLDAIFIDYLQIMDIKKNIESRERAIAEISRTLKEVAKELQVPVVALAQLNRSVESRSDRRPMLSDLRESGSIEQDADVIMMLYRDEYYEKENPDAKGKAEVIIGKQRNGPTGTVHLRFNTSIGLFEDDVPQSLDKIAPPPAPERPQHGGPKKMKNFAPGIGN